MLVKTITYEDFNGTERTEDFMFNLTKTELVKLEHSIEADLLSGSDVSFRLRMEKKSWLYLKLLSRLLMVLSPLMVELL